MEDNFEKKSQSLSKQMNLLKAKLQKMQILPPREKQEMKLELNEFQDTLDELNRILQYEKSNNSQARSITIENESRKAEYFRLIALKSELLNMINNPDQMKKDLFGKNSQPRTFANTVAQSGATNKQIQNGYKELKEETEKQIDYLIQNVQKTKHVAQKMNTELENHLEVTEDIEANVDKNSYKMIKTTGKMKKLVEETKQCHILFTIFIEIVILTLVIIYV